MEIYVKKLYKSASTETGEKKLYISGSLTLGNLPILGKRAFLGE